MQETAEVVIVGGGVIGASVAYHLASMGCRDVILVEKEAGLGMGSTGRSVGGIRQQFSTPANIQLSLRSVEKFRRFNQEVDASATFHWVGYLFLADNVADWTTFQENVALQRSMGVADVALMTPEQIGELVPQLNVDDLYGATFCASDGFGDPYEVCQGYAAAARRLGVKMRTETEVTDIRTAKGRVQAVVTRRGVIVAGWVVNAAGPYAGVVGRMAGVDLPIEPYRRQVFVTAPFDGLPEIFPMTIDFGPSFYFRREGPGVLFGMTDKDEPPGFGLDTDPAWLERTVEHAVHRVPPLAEARVMRGWGGLYDTTPDANPIIGSVPELEGFLCAAGFSGHGFMHSPITGQLIAELIVHGQPSVDISLFSVTRFTERRVAAEQAVI